jgi:hypothetical protein
MPESGFGASCRLSNGAEAKAFCPANPVLFLINAKGLRLAEGAPHSVDAIFAGTRPFATEFSSMTGFPDHPALTWIGQPALSLPVYAQLFDGAAVEIMGASPYLNAKAAGISFALHPDHSVRAVFLYAAGVEDFAQYAADPLPAGLSFSSTRADVRAVLGAPAMSADAGGVGLMAIDFAFDRFEDGARYLRFEYWPDDAGARLVTVGED